MEGGTWVLWVSIGCWDRDGVCLNYHAETSQLSRSLVEMWLGTRLKMKKIPAGFPREYGRRDCVWLCADLFINPCFIFSPAVWQGSHVKDPNPTTTSQPPKQTSTWHSLTIYNTVSILSNEPLTYYYLSKRIYLYVYKIYTSNQYYLYSFKIT